MRFRISQKSDLWSFCMIHWKESWFFENFGDLAADTCASQLHGNSIIFLYCTLSHELTCTNIWLIFGDVWHGHGHSCCQMFPKVRSIDIWYDTLNRNLTFWEFWRGRGYLWRQIFPKVRSIDIWYDILNRELTFWEFWHGRGYLWRQLFSQVSSRLNAPYKIFLDDFVWCIEKIHSDYEITVVFNGAIQNLYGWFCMVHWGNL